MWLPPRRARTTEQVESGDGGRDGGPLQEGKDHEERLRGGEHRLQVREALYRRLHHCAVSTGKNQPDTATQPRHDRHSITWLLKCTE